MPLMPSAPPWFRYLLLSARWHIGQWRSDPVWRLRAADALLAWHERRGDAGVQGGRRTLSPHASAQAIGHWQATRAHVLGEMERWDEARAQLMRLCEQQPNEPSHAFNLGFVCGQLGDACAAADAFRACIEQAPLHDRAWFGLGQALQALGDRQGAEQAWLKQVRLQPLCPDGYVCLVRLFVDRQDVKAASDLLARLRGFAPRQALSLEPLLFVPTGHPPTGRDPESTAVFRSGGRP